MSGDQNPPGRGAGPADRGRAESAADPPADSHAEQVLAQALRLMAGGGTAAERGSGQTAGGRRLTTGQLLLLAATVGLLVGIVAGFVSLM